MARANATVIVKVRRNENGPQFQPSATYEVEIPQNFEVGKQVIQVIAKDKDEIDMEMRYNLDNVTNNGLTYFLLEEKTGILRLKKPLSAAIGQFVAYVSANDQRGRTGRAVVNIKIKRSQFAPEFVNLPYNPSTVSENIGINRTVFTVEAQDQDIMVSSRTDLGLGNVLEV